MSIAAAAPGAAAQTDTAASPFLAAWTRAEAQNADIEAVHYNRQMRPGFLWRDGATLRSLDSPADKAVLECVTAIAPTPSPVRLLFTLDKSGAVVDARSDQGGYVAECLPRKVIGLRLPPPPQDGFLLCHTFEKVDGDRSVLSTCGPRPVVQSCERRGTSTSCRTEQR